ncbi:hypothetical protein Hanom_Chr03g00211191 [Helianthus anomalus]
MFVFVFSKNSIVYFIMKRVVYSGFSRKTGRVSSVFGRPSTTPVVVIISKFNKPLTI